MGGKGVVGGPSSMSGEVERVHGETPWNTGDSGKHARHTSCYKPIFMPEVAKVLFKGGFALGQVLWSVL